MVAKTEHHTRTGCPIACSLDLLGDHWTLLIVRNLMFNGHHEYKEMLEAEEQISSSMLTARLKKLESDGLISSVIHPESRKRKLYYLTSMGKGLVHVMVHLVLWADMHLSERLDIPPEKRKLMAGDPAAFAEATLERIDAWERENLQAQTGER